MPGPGDDVVPLSSEGRSSVESFRAEHRRELLTILFITDLANSTQLQSDLGNLEAALLTEMHRQLVREALSRFEAREIEWAGDSCLAVFAKPSDGVAFALRLQAALRRARTNEPRTPRVRIGLHVGEIVLRHRDDGSKRDDLFGLQVSEAARVMSLARADQIYCTRSVFDNARSALKNESIEGVGTIAWRNYGLFELKGSDEPAEICEVGEEGLAPFCRRRQTTNACPSKATSRNGASDAYREGVGERTCRFGRCHPLRPSRSWPESCSIARSHRRLPEAPELRDRRRQNSPGRSYDSMSAYRVILMRVF